MPRLDWQMWFAALEAGHVEPWFLLVYRRLLEGSEGVRDLLAVDPFPDAPPKYIRATLYRYRFTDREVRRSSGAWWTHERLGPYIPVLTLDAAGQLVPAGQPRS